MNLNNTIREDIINDVIKKTFDKEYADLKKQEHKIGMAAYNKLYPAKDRETANALPEGWIKKDKCLRFNIAGMDMIFNVNEAVAIKRSLEHGCYRLGNVADEKIKQDALDLHNDKETVNQKREKLRGQLKSVLYAVNTYKRLSETWPEGNKFYVKYAPKGDNSLLPAIRVNELNESLGLKSKE